VIALPTPNRPDRKVKVLRVSRPDGGEPLADLQDVATGARYTIPARLLTTKPPTGRPALVHNPTRWNRPAATAKPPAYKLPPPPKEERRPVPPVVAAPPVTPLPAERPLPPPVTPPPIVFPPPSAFVPMAVPPEPKPEVRPAGLIDPLPVPVPPPAADPMADETGPYLRDLSGALRPSVRERAATALAECRYGSRPEVKAQLAKAAASDPCPDVRAHCVKLLSKLGYHESRYLDELAGWAESGPPPLKQAAAAALARLAVKN
jgi:hypothetical protein